MRPLLIALTALLVAPAAASADRADCYPRGSKTVIRSKQARIYTVAYRGGDERQTFGCLYSRGKRFALDRPDTRAGETYESAFGPWRLAGRYVMYQWSWLPSEPMEYRATQIYITDLRTGRGVATEAIWSGDADNANDEAPEGDVVRTALRANGSGAWTSWNGVTKRGAEVWAIQGRRARRLDAGDDVDPRSLELSGRRITWTKAGQTQSAVLR